MKLSDMFSTLAENARSFEQRAAEWQEEMNARNGDLMAGFRKWQESAVQRQDDLNKQMQAHFEQAGENARKQWEAMQGVWEEQLQKMRDKGEEMREAAMKGGYLPDWAEAYAAQMVSLAQKMQDEAASAIASATEARAKGPKGGSTRSKKA